MHVNKKILKATVLWSIITCLEMDKQNIQVEEVCSIAYWKRCDEMPGSRARSKID